MNDLIWLVFCHLIGDYALQSDFLATTKGKNWYHLIVHCALYCVPFTVVFGLTWHIGVLFATHVVIDSMKARFEVLSYICDQAFHYGILLFLNLSGMGVQVGDGFPCGVFFCHGSDADGWRGDGSWHSCGLFAQSAADSPVGDCIRGACRMRMGKKVKELRTRWGYW